MLADPPREQVVYDDVDVSAPGQSNEFELEQEREKHRRRADRFRTDYVEPASEVQSPGRSGPSERQADGFMTGIDMFSEEEVARRERRAQRFQTHDQSLTYQPVTVDPEEAANEKAKQQRAKRFGTDYRPPDRTGLADADLYEPRSNADGEDMRRPEAVHLYGVDFMSSADCLRYFGEYGPSAVEWLNDSACNVVFADPQNAMRAIVRLGKPLLPEDTSPDDPGLDPADVRNLPYLWHRGQAFEKEGRSLGLLFRMATTADTKAKLSSGRTRRLWDLPVHQAERKAQQQKRRLQLAGGDQGNEQYDEDFDMGVRRSRGERGGARLQRRKRRRQGLGDIEMGSAEDDTLSGAEDGLDPDLQGDAPVTDLRELLSKRKEPSGLFSAAQAGVGRGVSPDAGERLQRESAAGRQADQDGVAVAAEQAQQNGSVG